LENIKAVNEKSRMKYDLKTQADRDYKINKFQLDVIAELHKQGMKQCEIATAIGVSQQTISSRLSDIRTYYPELLQ
jgi:predicted XRE-type DNA-binding protein